ncbi:MAG: phage tail tip lysozyme [Clostridium sp.]|nr:phage tail tip lysozyme [Clostridium sp.]
MGYKPRLTEPSYDDPYWIQTGSGGYNKCIYISGNSVLSNCVGYAYGRFMEIMGTTSCNLSINNAWRWYGNTSDGYKRGSTPKLGAVICWENPGDAGHVAIVEQINADGSIVTSNSSYGGKRFYTQTLYPPKYTWSSSFILQGFIYNPAVKDTQLIEDFIKEAKSHINEKRKTLVDWILPNNNTKWSAAFVAACAKKVGGLIGIIIPDCKNSTEFAEKGIKGNMGTFVEANKTPKSGDIILIRTALIKIYRSKYECDEIGIVERVKGKTITVIQGTSKETVESKTYKIGSSMISGYYRPDWSKVENNQSQMTSGYGRLGKFYDTENTEEDATIREVGYLSSGYKPTTAKSKIRLSVINYTTMMSAVMDNLLVPGLAGSSGENVILDGIENANARAVIERLMDKGLNAAAAIGIAANISHESGFRTDVIEYGYSFYNGGAGLCQWTNYPRSSSTGRKTNMVKFVGDNWRNNLTGQVDFLWYELQSDYPALMNILTTVPNTESGAKTAADAFLRKFEVPANIDHQSQVRQKTADELWSKIVIQITSGGSSSMNTAPMKGAEMVIPFSVQYGILGNYTYYDRNWGSGSVQRKLYDKWVSSGKPSNRNIATLDGYYLCAVTLIFGTTGDKISVVLEDNTTINCILGDSKGDDPSKHGENGNKYGHYVYPTNLVDVIEWEALVSHPSEIDLTGWKGKKVKKIINGGTYKI